MMDVLDYIDNLDALRAIIKRYQDEAMKLERDIIELVKHEHVGQKTYKIDDLSLTIKTGYNYLLNKEAYISMKNTNNPLLSCDNPFNPVVETMVPTLKTKVIKDAETYATPDIIDNLHLLVKKSELKPSITYKFS